MQTFTIKKGSVSQMLPIDLYDSASTTGGRLPAVVFNTAGLSAYYNREGAAGAATAITLVTATKGTYTSSGFIAIDGTNVSGHYELDPPDAVFATGANWAIIVLKGATGLVMKSIFVRLVDNVEKDIFDIVNHASYGNALLVRSTTPANTLDVAATGEAGLDFSNAKAGTATGAVIPTVTAVTNDVGITQAGADKAWSTATRALTDKAGFSLAATGLDAIAATATGMVEIAKATWDRALTGATHNVISSAGRRVRNLGAAALFDGTASAGGTDTITLAGGSATSNIYVGTMVAVDGGTGAGQSRYIVAYDGATKIATVARAWSITPDSTSTFVVLADSQIQFIHIGTAQAGAAATITFDAGASATDNIYVGQVIRILAGTGDNQIRLVTAYNGTTKVATVSPAWTTTPGSTSVFATLQVGQTQVAKIVTDAVDAAALNADAGTEIGTAVWAATARALTDSPGVKKNTALANFMFFMVDSTDHATGKTGLTITAQRSLDGAAFAACANSASEVAVGWYKINLAAADVNGDVVALRFTGASADARNLTVITET